MDNGDVVRADVIGDWNQTVQLVETYQLQLQSGGPIDAADVLDDLAEWFDALWLLIRGYRQALTFLRRIKAQLVPDGDIIGEYTYSTPKTGQHDSPVSSTTVTAPLSFLTTVPRVILRKSYGPMAEAAINDDGELTSGVQGALADVAVFLLDTFVATNGAWNYGYYSPKAAGFVQPFAAVITTAPGTMARRRLGRGA